MFCRALAPLLAGIVRDLATWRWAMLINIPLAIVSMVLLYLFMPEFGVLSIPLHRRNIVGVVSLTGSLMLAQVILARGEQWEWFASAQIYWFSVLAVLGMGVFFWTQLRPIGGYSFFDLKILNSDPLLRSCLPITLMLGLLFAQGLYTLPQYLRQVLTHSATQDGVFFAVNGFATAAGAYLGGKLFAKLKGRIVTALGLILISAAMFWFSYFITSDTPDAYLYPPLILEGCGVAFMLVGVSVHLFPAEPRSVLTSTMSLWMWMRRLGQVFGSSLFTIYLDHRLTLHSARLNENVFPSNPAFQNRFGGLRRTLGEHGLLPGVDALSALKQISRQSAHQYRALAYADVFLMIGCVCVFSLIFVFLMRSASSKPIEEPTSTPSPSSAALTLATPENT